jgi:hypothetical protein
VGLQHGVITDSVPEAIPINETLVPECVVSRIPVAAADEMGVSGVAVGVIGCFGCYSVRAVQSNVWLTRCT